MADPLIITGLWAATAGLLQLVRPLLLSFVRRHAERSRQMKITVKASDGTPRELTIGNPAAQSLDEEQLKQIIKLLSEADNGDSKTRNAEE